MPDVLVRNLPYLLQGAVVTLWLSVAVVGLGTLLGVALGILATTRSRYAQALVTAYIFVLRGIPVLVVMFLGYYAFPAFGFRVSAYVAVGLAQIVYLAAFVADALRHFR